MKLATYILCLTILVVVVIGCFGCDTQLVADCGCDKIDIGKEYTLYFRWDVNDPFDKETETKVVVVDKKDGYVQYSMLEYYNNPDVRKFSKDCKHFLEQLKHSK